MKKFKALVTAEIIAPQLEEALSDKVEFCYAGYYLDHNVLPHEELLEKVRDIDILICEYDTISADVFDAANNLKIIICCRGGVKTVVDIEKAMQNRVIVCHNQGRNAEALTDLVIGYIIDLTRNITKTNQLIHSRVITADASSKPKEYKDTVWGLDNNSPFIRYRGRSINQMTLGLVGFGNTGRSLARKANALGMKILAYDPYTEFKDKPDYVKSVHFEELLACSDIISLHCILSSQTRNMFSAKEFEQMKTGSYFINTSRGELVIEEDLIASLKSGKLAGAALDVTIKEPIASDSPLLDAPNLLITPHIAGSAEHVQIRGTEMVLESLSDWINGEKPRNSIVYK